MKRFIYLAALAAKFAVFSATAASLDSWIGDWKGSCELAPASNGVTSFKTSLGIKPILNSKDLKWELIYEANGNMAREVRNYNLLAINKNEGHYIVDENNGLLLDSYLIGPTLYSPFVINGKLITVTYTQQTANEMLVDMPMFGASPIRKTCITGNLNLCASSFPLLSVQRCKLTKQKE